MKKNPSKKAALRSALQTFETDYHALSEDTQAFSLELDRQLTEIFYQEGVSLAVPIESRVKSWQSISEKLERKALELSSIQDLTDLIGVRAILLFRRDVEKASSLIRKKFDVLTQEDTIERLDPSQFGYSSIHFIIRVPSEWLKVPTLARFAGYKAELQIRMIAQHLWAASSHLLQYKQEASVPPPVRRSIYRVSALLETVDLEFERLLQEREQYSKHVDTSNEDEILNVDLLEKHLDTLLPMANKHEPEPYSDLLADLLAFDITTPKSLIALIKQNESAMLKEEADTVKKRREEGSHAGTSRFRIERGVFYRHVGLVRSALEAKFGVRWKNYRDVKHRPIENLALSPAVESALRAGSITTVVDLASKSESDLLRLADIKPESIDEIHSKFKAIGLTLGMNRVEAAHKIAQGKAKS